MELARLAVMTSRGTPSCWAEATAWPMKAAHRVPRSMVWGASKASRAKSPFLTLTPSCSASSSMKLPVPAAQALFIW